jgi:tetratricopeptide (TPR) repeat protein
MLLNLAPRVGWAGEGDKAVARAHYETATRLYEIREYADALKEYKAAYLARPDAAFLFNIGQCLRKLDRNTEALDFFQQYLKKAPPDDPNRGLVEARIRNIHAGLNSDHDPFDKSGAAKTAPPAAEVRPLPTPSQVSPPEPTHLPAAPSPVTAPSAPQPAGADLATPAAAMEVQASTPMYRTWWFWTGVGAVVVAGTVTAIVLASRGGGTSIPVTTLGSRSIP